MQLTNEVLNNIQFMAEQLVKQLIQTGILVDETTGEPIDYDSRKASVDSSNKLNTLLESNKPHAHPQAE